MATSFISFKEYGFWINDGLMEVTLHYMNKTFLNYTDREEWQEQFRMEIENCSKGFQRTFINFGMDEYLIDDSRIEFFVNDLIPKVLRLVMEKGEYIEKAELNDMIVDEYYQGEWTKDLSTKKIIHILLWLKGLALGVVRLKASDFIYYRF